MLLFWGCITIRWFLGHSPPELIGVKKKEAPGGAYDTQCNRHLDGQSHHR